MSHWIRSIAMLIVLAACPLPFLLYFQAASRDALFGWFVSYFVVAALAFAWALRGPPGDGEVRRWRFDRRE